MAQKSMANPSAVTVDLLQEIISAFNEHDVERIMSYFAEDCTFQMASGPEKVGRTVRGRDEIGKVLSDRFKLIPDMHWQSLHDYVCGNRAVSVWIVSGKAYDGTTLNQQGCDLWEFRDQLVVHKDTYWKAVTSA